MRIPIGLMIVLTVMIWGWSGGRNGTTLLRLLIVVGWAAFLIWLFLPTYLNNNLR